MTKNLFFSAIGKFFAGFLCCALILFLPAGTLQYWNAWLFLAGLFIPMFLAGLILMVRDPKLLESRLNAKEEESEQKTVVLLSGIMFLAAFITAGLNFRFSWFAMPAWIVRTGVIIFLLAYLMYAEVLRENAYLSRTIEIRENQPVIDTGLYGIVRHPMYCATLFLFLSMGLILGSPVSCAILLCYIPIIAKRIRNEEKVLAQGLKGYKEYMERVKYKVIPYIW